MSPTVEHVLVADSNLTVGPGWRCERCRLWSRTREIAAGSPCVSEADVRAGVRRWPDSDWVNARVRKRETGEPE